MTWNFFQYAILEVCLISFYFYFAELNEKGAWERLEYYKKFDEFKKVDDNCERIHVNDVSPEEFIEKYEKLYKPVVICGIQDDWQAKYKWTLQVYKISSENTHIKKL